MHPGKALRFGQLVIVGISLLGLLLLASPLAASGTLAIFASPSSGDDVQGNQQSTILNPITPPGTGWQQGFDFRNTASYVTDPPGDTYVLPTMAYPSKANGVTFGWVKTSLVQGRDRSIVVDPRLAGINFANNGSPATFYVDLPSAGTYNLSLALGDAGWRECWVQCQIQFLDGSKVLATVTGGALNMGYFYDAKGNTWAAAAWPGSNVSQQVTLTGTRLTMVVGTNNATGDYTTVAFLGVTQVSGSPNFSISASPSSLTIQQGDQGTSTITTTISGGFNSAISLSASGMPSGVGVSFNPQTIPAPGAGTSTMTITVSSSTPVGTYPITVTGNGGGIQQNTAVTLTVIQPGGPDFAISASPSSLSIAVGHLGTTTITTTISGGFNNAISLSATGMPLGVAVAFNPQTIPAPGDGSSTMTFSVLMLTKLGTYPITVTGSGGSIKQSTTVTLTVVASQDFQLSASPGSVSVVQGDQGTTTITSTISGGFNNAVSLSATGMPSGTTVSFSPQTIPAPGSGNSTVTISVTMATYPGSYTINVAGSGGGIQRYTPIALTVIAAPNFAIGASPSALTVAEGSQGTSTITTFVCCGFDNSIALSATGAPSGTTLKFNPATISAPGSGSSTMTATVGKSTVTGTYPITVTGNGGGVQQSTTVNLTVTGGPAPTDANYMEPYSYSLQSSFGQPPYSYQITSGSLPAGLSMDASGTISGTATAVGKFNFHVKATDSAQPPKKQSSSYTLNVVIGLDEYSGLTAAPVPGCTPTGYFQLVKVKIGSNPARWVYADPLCNAFYQMGVYDATSYFLLKGTLESRYNNDLSKWANHSLQREIASGFNTNDIFYSDYMLPIPKGGNTKGASIKLPFLLYFGASQDAIFDPTDIGIPEAIKNIIGGQDDNGYQLPGNIYNLDLMDPNWLVANQGELALQLNPALGGFPDGFNTTPWVAAISLGDSDEYVLFKGSGPGGYAHPAMVVATSAFNFNKPPINGNWQRPILYSKAAWTCNAVAHDSQNFPPGQSYLEKKYGTVAALNASWGSNYTAFCDAGGFGSGTGVLDEDGRHTAWFGSDFYNQTGMNSNLKADLDKYLYIMGLQIYTPQISVVSGYDPNHLMMCGFYGGGGDFGVRPIVAQALRDSGCQVLVLTWNSTYISQSLANNQAVYDITGLPATVFQASTAQLDSDMSNYPNNGAGYADYPTQLLRGQHYGDDTQDIYGAQGTNTDYYGLGIDVWSLTDNSNQNQNLGFISLSDNVYDGLCATRAFTMDQWGYPCGFETADYGDFTDGVTQANTAVLQQLIQQLRQ